MSKLRLIFRFGLAILLILAGCTIDVSQSNPTPIPANPNPLFTTTAQPLPGTTLDATGAARQGISTPDNNSTTNATVPWLPLNLKGKLIFISAASQQGANPIQSVQELDLVSGNLTTLFQGPAMTWIYSLAISPDGKQLVLGYSAPESNGDQPIQTLYQMPMDGSAPPQMLIPVKYPEDEYLQPEWSPDGKYLYYAHVDYRGVSASQPFPDFYIYRMAYPNGAPEKIADHAFWPRISGDGSRLVYISSDINTGKNKIFIADLDGRNAQEVKMSGPVEPDIIDAPIFSPDGKVILFSAPVPAKSTAPTWFESILGVTVVDAHSVPSEWWSVPVEGGIVTQLTNLQYAGLFASIAPDGQHIASFSANGLFVMNPDASNVTMIIPDLGGVFGTVSWLP